MTAKVTITNDSETHDIGIIDGAGSRYVLHPTDSVSVHVWKGTEIVITELDLQSIDNKENT